MCQEMSVSNTAHYHPTSCMGRGAYLVRKDEDRLFGVPRQRVVTPPTDKLFRFWIRGREEQPGGNDKL